MRAHTSSTDPPWPSSTQQLRQQGAEQPRGRLQQAAVSSPGNSLERQEGWPRPSWIRAISRVRGSLREQRGEGCEKLEEPMLVRARSRKIKVRAPGTGHGQGTRMCLGSIDRHDPVASTLAAHGLRCFLLRCGDAARKHNICRDPNPLLPLPAFVSSRLFPGWRGKKNTCMH